MLTEQEEMIRRYLDRELSPEEEAVFKSRLAGDPDLRAEVHALEKVLREARSLRAYHAPKNLAARVSRQLRPKATVPQEQSRSWSPFSVWVPALAAAVLIALAFLFQSRTDFPWQLTHTPEGTVLVTFQLKATGAHEVSVAGDFNQWQIGSIQLEDREGDGVWTASVPIPSGRYYYQFVIDRNNWLPDPAAPIQVDDGFGNKNSVLEVAVTDNDGDRLT